MLHAGALSVSGVGDMVANLTVLCDRDRAHLTAVSNGLHVTAIRLAQECSFQTGLNQSNINSTVCINYGIVINYDVILIVTVAIIIYSYKYPVYIYILAL